MSIRGEYFDLSSKSVINLKDFEYKPDTYGTIRAMGIDKYPGESQIIRELIQNADDAKAESIWFRINQGEILVENDGKPFTKPNDVDRITESDFYRISHIGCGKTEEEATGTFGIGFTSVFHITDYPRIVSNGLDFGIRVNEYPVVSEVPFDEITRFHLPIRSSETDISRRIKAEPFDQTKLEGFESQLARSAYRDVFFLRTLRRIEAYKEGKRRFLVSRKGSKVEKIAGHTKGRAYKQNLTISITTFSNNRRRRRTENWIVYSLVGLIIPPDLENLGQRIPQRVAIAVPLDWKTSKIIKSFDSPNYAYYTLPVTPTGFSLKYNASKLYVTSGRGEFVDKEGKQREWNTWQADNIAELLAAVVHDLAEMKVNPKAIYEFIPTRSKAQNPMDECILYSFQKKVDEQALPLFYVSHGKWIQKGNVYRNWDGLHKVLPEHSGKYLVSPDLQKFDEVFECYGIDTLDVDDFVDYLQEKYGTASYESNQSEDPVAIRKIFEYLGKRRRIDSSLMDRLRKICILLTEECILRSYEYKVYLPTDQKMPLISKDDIIHHATWTTTNAKRFLKKLGIKAINLEHLILHSFLQRVRQYNSEQKVEFIWYLIKRKKDVLRRREIVQELRKKSKEILLWENCGSADDPIFFRDAELRTLFGDKLNYLSREYEQRGKKSNIGWRDFLRRIGVKDYPDVDKILLIVQEIESMTHSLETVRWSNGILKFLDTNWRKFYSKQRDEIRKLSNYRWIPTDKQSLACPTDVYVNRRLRGLVGDSVNFIAISPPKRNGLLRILGFLSQATIDDVIKFILASRGEEHGQKDRFIDFKVYSWLNRKVSSLDEPKLKLLRENRTIWFRHRLWSPQKLFKEDHTNQFGPNGWVRGYLKKNRLSRLNGLCLYLRINRPTENAEEYSNWLCDAADRLSKKETIEYWHVKLIRNAYSKLARMINEISGMQIERLSHRKMLLASESQLRLPKKCYIVRKSEDVILKRILKSGIRVPIVKPENAELEKLFLKLGSNEATCSIKSKRVDNSEIRCDEDLTDRFHKMLPWLDGFEFSTLGETTDSNLLFQKLKVYRAEKLVVHYHLKSQDQLITGHPIKDVCCLDDGTIYLDAKFSLKEATNENLHLLSVILSINLNQKIDMTRWNLVILSLLFYGTIPGISPYDRESHTEPVQEIVPKASPIEHEMPRIRPSVEATSEELEADQIFKPKGFEVIQEPMSTSEINTLLSETDSDDASQASIIDVSQIAKGIKKKRIKRITSSPSIVWRKEPKVIAAKNWQPQLIDGEEVYIEKGLPLPPIRKIRRLKALTSKIVTAMGFDPEIVNICVARAETDGYNHEKQLFFNATRSDSPYRWFGVVARELAYNYSRLHYPHVKAMIAILEKGLRNINTVFPELTEAS